MVSTAQLEALQDEAAREAEVVQKQEVQIVRGHRSGIWHLVSRGPADGRRAMTSSKQRPSLCSVCKMGGLPMTGTPHTVHCGCEHAVEEKQHAPHHNNQQSREGIARGNQMYV